MKHHHRNHGARALLATLAAGALALLAGCSANSNGQTVVNNGGATSKLIISPSAVPQGSGSTTFTFAWNHPEASMCQLSGTDPSGAAVTGLPSSTSNSANETASLSTATAGTYTFNLTCTNAQTGAKTTDTGTIMVYTPTSAFNLTASPSSYPKGAGDANGNANVALTWNHPEASSCSLTATTPAGATSSLSVPSPSTSGNVTTQVNTKSTGTYTYKLMCTPTAGGAQTTDTATTTVFAAATDQALTATPNVVSNGAAVALSWNHPSASTCQASETDPAGNPVTDFTGTQPASPSSPFMTQALTQNGTYTFKLACTDGSGATVASDTATVAVTAAVANDCGVSGVSSSKLMTNVSSTDTTFKVTPADNSSAQITSGLCLGCSVSNPGNSIDSDLTNAATLNNIVGLLGASVSLRIANTTTTPYPAGSIAGVVGAFPQSALDAGVLQTVTIDTLLRDSNGNEQLVESADATNTSGGSVKVQLLGLIGGGNNAYASFQTTKPFDAVQVDLGGLANVLNTFNVYYGCVAQP